MKATLTFNRQSLPVLPIKEHKRFKIASLIVFLLVTCSFAFGQTTITSTTAGGAWGTAGTWIGGVVPTSANNVVIDGPVTLAAAASANNLTINASKSLALGTQNFTVTGTTSISGTLSDNSATGTNTFTGAMTINSTGLLTSTAAVTFPLNGGGVNNGTITLNSGGTLTIGAGQTFTNNATVAMTALLSAGNASSTWVNGNGANLTYNNATAPMNAGILDASAATNTVTYGLAGAQNVKGATYNTLAFGGNNTKTSTGDIVVTNPLSISGVTFNIAGFNFTANSTITNAGTLQDNSASGTNIIVGLFTNSGTFTTSNNPAFEFQNGINNTGTVVAGNGAYLFSTNNQSISGTSQIVFGGSVTIGDNVELTNNQVITISGVLTGLSATAVYKAGVGSTLNYANNTSPMAGGVMNVSALSNTFNYSSNSGTQNVKETTYHNLSFTNGAIRSVPNVTINGNFSRTGGTITSPSTTWTFETSNAATFSPTGSISFPNIVVNKPGGSLSIIPTAAGQTTTFLSLTVGSGSIILGNAFTTTLTITEDLAGAGTLDLSGLSGHILNLGGVNNSIQTFLTPAGTGSATVNYNRAGNQIMFSSANYRNIGITGNGDKTLGGSVSVDGTLNLAAASGRIILGSTNLKIKPAGSITTVAFSASRMISTDGTGTVVKEVTTTNPFSGSFVFPIGSNNVYTPYTITSITATYTGVAYVSARAVPQRQPNVPYYNNALIRYWDIESANLTISSANVAFLYVNTPGEVVGSNALYVPRVWNGTTLAAPPTPSGASTNPLTSTGTTFLTGQWTALDPTVRTTLYSYQSGDWSDINTWTTDPSGSTLVSSIIPGVGDQVVILNGRTITTSIARTIGALTIDNGGTLDLGTTSGHSLGSVDGQGLLRMSSINYPGGVYTSFVSTTGGTIEYYDLPAGTNVLASTPASVNVYNNLVISNSTSNNFTLNLNSSINVNGNLSISKSGSGTAAFNFGNTTGNFSVTVLKNVTIGSGCTIGVNNSYNGVHTFNIHGTLDVTGTIDLTNGAAYTAPTNGRATLNFYGTVSNTQATFNAGAVADFYDVTMQKNEGYELYVNASPSATVGFNGAGYTIRPILGTLHLGANITIPRLINGGNYDLGAPGVLPVFWIDGAIVTDGGVGGAIVPYGTLKITAGSLTCVNGQGAVVIRESGLFQMDGGTATMQIFRTSTTAVTHRGSFVMNGGTLNITGNNGGEGTFYAMFSLPYPENVFQMSNGTINITRTVGGTITPRGGIMIASNAQNYQVTGGTINISVTGNQSFDVTSTAPFYNVNISKASAGTGVFQLNPISWSYDGAAGNTAIVPAQPLRVLNNLTLVGTTALSFLGNGNNVETGGNFTINTGVTFSTATGLLVFNGNANQAFTMSGTAGVAGIGGLTVDKNPATTLSVTGSATNIAFIGGLNLLRGTLADGGKNLLFGGNIVNNATHTGAGKIALNGTSAQTIGGSGNGVFQNLEMASTSGAAGSLQITATSNVRVNGNFTMSTDRRMSIGINKLILSGTSQILATSGTFGVNRFIQTDGFLSDGGIVKTFSSTAAVVFPFGTGTNYTPATIQFTSAPTAWGTLDVRPVTARQLYVTDPDAFVYHWKVRQTGFTGVPANSVNLTFNYGSLADNLTYIPAFYDYQAIAFTTINDVSKVDEVSNNILFNGVSYFNGDFTAGSPAAFGVVIPFYSRANGSWNTPSTWSNNPTLKHTGAASALIPSSNSPVFIGDGTTYFHTITVPTNNTVSGSLIVDAGSILDLGSTTGNNFGALPYATAGGAGKIRISSTSATAEFPAGDFGIFFTIEGGTTEYYSGATAFTIPTISAAPTSMQIRSYRNLIINPSASSTVTLPNRDLEIFENMTTSGNAAGVALMNNTSAKTLLVHGNFDATSGNLQFGNSFAQTVIVEGNMTIGTTGAMSVQNTGSVAHPISLYGNLTNNGTINFNQASDVDLSFIGSNSRSITGTNAAATTSFNKVTINKGTSSLVMVNVDVQGTLIAPTNNWLTLQNGMFRISKASTLTLTDAVATNFLIPASSALSLNHIGAVVNVAMGNDNLSDVVLAGKLEINNGTLNIGNSSNNVHNDLEYAASDIPQISVQGNGVLNVNGQIRRSVSVFLGSLNYTQKDNSIVLVRGKNAEAASSFNLNRAKFEVLNTGSQFTMQDNALLIIDRNGLQSGIFGDLYLAPESYVITGGEIRFGTSDTPPSATESTFLVNTSTPFWNFTVDGTVTNKTVRLLTDAATIKSNLSILGNSVFDANGLNVSIAGNLINQNTTATTGVAVGGYRAGTVNQITTFNGTSAAQTLTGASGNITNFANLVIDNTFASGALTLQTNSTVRVNGAMSILNGGFNSAANLATVTGNIINNQTHTSSGAGYMVLAGTSAQTIGGNGNGVYGSLRVNNAAGVELEAPATVNGDLNFVAGLFYINNFQLTLGELSTVTGTLNASSMIRLNGVTSDGGVRKLYPASASDFTFPVGVTLKYTPARINVTSNSTAGSVTMKVGNVRHPATTDVVNKELTYYWSVSSTGFNPSTVVTHVYNYLQTDAINGTETSYRTGRYVNNIWNPQFGITSSVNATNNTMTLTGVNYFNGDFTAGEQTEFDQLLVYYSRNATLGGNWNDPNSWSTDAILTHAGAAASTAPAFNSVIIAAGHTITTTANNAGAPTAQIDGTLNLGNFIGNNLGTVTGTGTIRLAPTLTNQYIFPAGNFAAFTSTGGGTIEYFNSSVSAALPSQGTYNNLLFSGSGTKNLFNSDIQINGNLTIAAGVVSNTNNKNIFLKGDFTNTSSSIALSTGTTAALHLTGANQTITGASILGRLTVNGAGVKTLNSTITVANTLTLTSGVIQTGANQIALSLGALSIGASASSYVNGNFLKVISTGTATRTFEVGDATTYTPVTIQFAGTTNSGGSFTVYSRSGDHPSSASAGIDNTKSVNRYWGITNSGVNGYSSTSLTFNFATGDVDPTANTNNLSAARFSASVWTLPNVGTRTSTSLQVTGITAFGEFQLAEPFSAGITWTGSVNSDWNNPGNWNPNVVPTGSDNITIPVTVNQPSFLTAGNGNVRNVVMQLGAIINVPSSYSLTVNGNFTSINGQVTGPGTVRFTSPIGVQTGATTFAGVVAVVTGAVLTTNNNLTLASGATLMHGIGTPGAGGSISGNVRIRRNGAASSLSYNYWSSPINNGSIASLSGGNKYMYDPTAATGSDVVGLRAGWVAPGSTMSNGRGYISTGAGTSNFIGSPNNGNVSYGPLQIGTYTNFNLVGNPYPSAISASSFISANPQILGGAIYFWDDDNSAGGSYSAADYGVYNGIGFVSPNSGKTFNGNIAACQGFFVQASAATTLNFTNSMRTALSSTFFEADILERVWLSVTTPANDYNEVLIAFKDDATDGADEQFDAKKLRGNSNLALYTKIGTEDYAINAMSALSSDKVVQIGLESSANGPQVFRLQNMSNLPESAQIILEDTKLGIFHNLRNIQEYNYVYDSTTDVLRFRLHFKPEVMMSAVTESCVQNDGQIIINSPSTTSWNYSVTNQEGTTVAQEENFTGTTHVNSLAGGIYFIHLNNEFGTVIHQAIEVTSGAPVSATLAADKPMVEITDAQVNFTATVTGASDITWDFGDGTIVTGVLNPVHVYTAPGTYTVTLIASNVNCMDVKSIYVTVRDITTGIANVGKEAFSMFPNPVASVTTINLRLPEREAELVLNVVDAAGKLVKTQSYSNVDRTASLQLNVADLAVGVYQVLINGGKYSAAARLTVTR